MFSFNEPPGMCPRCRGLGRELVFDLDALIDWTKSLREGAIKHRHFAEGRWLWKRIYTVGLFDLDKPLNKWAKTDLDLLLHAEKTALKDHEANKYFNQTWEGIVAGIKRRSSGREDEATGSPVAEMQYFRFAPCPECRGSRLSPLARSVKIEGKGLDELSLMELADLRAFLRASRDRSRRRSCAGRTRSSGTWSTSASATSPSTSRSRPSPAANPSG